MKLSSNPSSLSSTRVSSTGRWDPSLGCRVQGNSPVSICVSKSRDRVYRPLLLHVLPSGFKRIRHNGLLSPARKNVGLAAARSALAVPPPEPAIIESVAVFLCRVVRLESMCCPRGGRFGSQPRCYRCAVQRPEGHHETSHKTVAASFSCGWPGHSRTGLFCYSSVGY